MKTKTVAVIAGSYEEWRGHIQYLLIRAKNPFAMPTSEGTVLIDDTAYICIDSPERLKGLRNYEAVFIGSWRSRPDADDIEAEDNENKIAQGLEPLSDKRRASKEHVKLERAKPVKPYGKPHL